MTTATMSGAVTMPEDLFDMPIDGSEVTQEKLEQKGGAGTVNKDGKYHVLVKGLEKERADWPKVPSVRIDFEILAGTEESQVGKVHFHRVYLAKKGDKGLLPLSEGSRANLLKFFCNLGLLTKEEVAGNAQIRLPWEKLEYFQCIIEIKNEPYAKKDESTGEDMVDKAGNKVMLDSFKIPYGCNVWQLGDERVSSVPTDPDALAEFTGGAGIADVSDI